MQVGAAVAGKFLERRQENPMKNQNPDAGLDTADVAEMVTQLANDARALMGCGDFEAAKQALDQASLYAADAGDDVSRRFHGLLLDMKQEVQREQALWGISTPERYRRSFRHNPTDTRKLKTKLLR